MTDNIRRVVIYARVSSEDQKQRLTVDGQIADVRRAILADPGATLLGEYVDDGVSGTIPMENRPHGGRLLRDASRGAFDEVWVFKLDRIGRDDIDPLVVRRQLTRLGVKLVSVHDPARGDLEYSIRVAIAAEERRTLLLRSSVGMTRAAEQGRYCGGIVPLGYKVEGVKHTARLVISDDPMWQSWSESEVVHRMFRWCAADQRTCPEIAEELNRLGVPTAYQKAGRAVRKRMTRGEWTPGRIRQILTSTVYKGIDVYGKRGKREPITRTVPAIVSEATWDEAQRTLATHRLRKQGATENVYLLRSVMRCDACGLNYSGIMGRGFPWYRCNGAIAWRGKFKGRCQSKSLDGRVIEPEVWTAIERWLLDPGPVLQELADEQNANGAAAVAAAEIEMLRAKLEEIPAHRNAVLDMMRKGLIDRAEAERQLQAAAAEAEALEARLRRLEPETEVKADYTPDGLLEALRGRVQAGFTPLERQHLVALLVKRIDVRTEVADGKKRAAVVIHFRFPVVADGDTGTGSSRRRA